MSFPFPSSARSTVARATWQAIAAVLAALLAWAAWRGYQNPDLLLDLAAFRLC
jgi:hypothetical protein